MEAHSNHPKHHHIMELAFTRRGIGQEKGVEGHAT